MSPIQKLPTLPAPRNQSAQLSLHLELRSIWQFSNTNLSGPGASLHPVLGLHRQRRQDGAIIGIVIQNQLQDGLLLPTDRVGSGLGSLAVRRTAAAQAKAAGERRALG